MSDLAGDWRVSIAVKITAPIMWAIVLISIALAIFMQHNYENEIKHRLKENANHLAYTVGNLLLEDPPITQQALQHQITELLDEKEIRAIGFSFDNQNIIIGNKPQDSITITLPLTAGTLWGQQKKITLHHPPLTTLIAEERKETLLTMGSGFLIFGFFLAWIIRLIAIKPILELVDATRAISGGNLQHRLGSDREDEFGYLARFFNQMLDQLEDRQLELEKSVAKAEQANTAKSTFLANMSHELRTPLNAVMGYSEMLQEDAEEAGQTQNVEDLKKIHGAGKHLLSLIDSVLDISKIEAGKMELHIEKFSILSLINDVTSTITPLTDRNGNSLSINCAEDIGTMTSDMTRVRQTLLNLLSNASKFTKQGAISIKVERYQHNNRDWINFIVSDNGIGISDDQSTNLFQAFTQADSTTTREYGGTGLGLAISRRFCEMMGGDIDLQSKIDEGSVFTIRLPAFISDNEQFEDDVTQPSTTIQHVPEDIQNREIENPPAEKDERRKQATTVLAIDDDPAILEIIQRFLKRSGFNVITAENGNEGLSKARELLPDVITLDMMMPGFDGWSVLKELKQDVKLAHIPVIVLTMVDNDDSAFVLGAAEYISKPIDSSNVTKAIIRCVRKQKSGSEILLVNKNKSQREQYKKIIEGTGLKVIEAETAADALLQLNRHAPELILFEPIMPDMDAIEFTEKIRTNKKCKKIPLILLASDDLGENDVTQLKSSAVNIVHKDNASADQIALEIQNILSLHTEQ